MLKDPRMFSVERLGREAASRWLPGWYVKAGDGEAYAGPFLTAEEACTWMAGYSAAVNEMEREER